MPEGPKSPRRRVSAGLLMFRRKNDAFEVLLVHPGGPFFQRKDDGAWTIPKGEATPGEDLLSRAQIEFEEELGTRPHGNWIELGSIKQRGGKIVHAGPSKAICPKVSDSNRIHSKWSGRRDRENSKAFQKSIKRSFSRKKLRGGKSIRPTLFCSTGYVNT
jgi:predicted NUDIX family NTP pyrophosphohydrolase